ncbi:MAG: hypothetical protein ACRDQ4_02920 [Pseudonocardiaceae bacterium]
MSADDPLLDRATIEHAFRRLGDRLARRGIVVDRYVFGDAAMALAVEDVLALCTEVFPDEDVPARARLVLEDAFDDH